ncbi:MAG: hypothetical protein RL318_686 [Fibrobacterota bacterium]|jgi:penicillin-binding protein 1A
MNKVWAQVRRWSGWHRILLALKNLFLTLPDPRTPHRAWKIAALAMGRTLLAIVLLVVALDMNFLWLFGRSPSWSQLSVPRLAEGSEIWSSDSVLMGRYYLYDRSPIDTSEIPATVEKALLASEDIRFYKHHGVDPKAPFAVVASFFRGGPRGGSTITQQLAKNLFQTRGSASQGLLGHIPGLRTIVFKAKEWICALKLETLHDKRTILVLYLNTVDFGNNAWGIQAASRAYFSITAAELNQQQAALLVGLLKAPSAYDPIRRAEKAQARRNTVLSQMVKYRFLDRASADSLSTLPLDLKPSISTPEDGMAPFFRQAIAPWLREWCKANGWDLNTDGLRIHVTIDSRMQTLAEEAMKEWMATLQRRFDDHWSGTSPWAGRTGDGRRELDSVVMLTPQWKQALKASGGDTAFARKEVRTKAMRRIWTEAGMRDSMLTVGDSLRWMRMRLQGGLVALAPEDSRVLAWAGGRSWALGKFDHVLQSKRQPGSTFKPFVYATALTQGWGPCDKLMDRMVTIKYEEDGKQKSWTPHNADWTNYDDSVTLRLALGQSINTVTAQLTQKVGPEKVAEFARACGITSNLKGVPSIGLGTNPVSPLELGGAYCPMVNGGTATKPWFVTRIKDRDGNVLAEFKPESRKVLEPEDAWLMMHMLKGGIEEPGGTSQALYSYNVIRDGQLGGKTGTSNDHRDGWFVGISPRILGVAWTGNDDPALHWRTGEAGEGSRTGLPLFATFLRKVFDHPDLGYKPAKFPEYPGKIARRWNCPTPWDAVFDTVPDSTAVDSLGLDSLNRATTPTP